MTEVVHSGRVFMVPFHKGGGHLFKHANLKINKSGRYTYTTEEERSLENFSRTADNEGHSVPQPAVLRLSFLTGQARLSAQ